MARSQFFLCLALLGLFGTVALAQSSVEPMVVRFDKPLTQIQHETAFERRSLMSRSRGSPPLHRQSDSP